MIPAIIPVVSALAQVVPSLVGWFSGDKAQDRAQRVADLAMSVAGVSDPNQAVDAILKDPQLAAQFRLDMERLELEFYREETRRMEIVNQTMRVEYESGSLFKTGWRPFIGWVFGASILLFILAVVLCIAVSVLGSDRDMAGRLIAAVKELVSSLDILFVSMMTVLGVAVKKRSDDKQVASGQTPTGVLGGLAGLFGGVK